MRVRACLAALALLAGCTATEVDQGILYGQAWDVDGARESEVPADPYLAALREGYLALAADERAEFDWNDAAEFRARALRAAAGEAFGPVRPSERNLPEAAMSELEAAFVELSGFLASEGAVLRAGRQLGEAQVQFECWLQEAEEAHQDDQIVECREAYEALMVLIRDLAKLPDNMAVVLPDDDGGEPGGIVVRQGDTSIELDRPFAAAGVGEQFGDLPVAEGEIRDAFSGALAARPKPPREFVVTFAFGSARVSDAQFQQVMAAAEEARSRPAPEVIVTGHADAVGSPAANLALSRRRAAVVARAVALELRERERVTFMRGGRGERDLLVPTPGREEDNRRVVILVR